jgi:GH24 family phage-related lysozyme (muramidase)
MAADDLIYIKMSDRTKVALTSIAVLVVFMANAGIAAAQTFNDVTKGSWYFDYVEQLATEGIINTNSKTYRPNDSITRADLVSMVIAATGGLTGFDPPVIPTFSDVPKYARYYEDIEAAAKRGIVNGYTDANGNPTGKFGPHNTVTRAEAAKILIIAFNIPQSNEMPSNFSDVKMGAWYTPYVVSATNRSIADGYANGTFGPADPVTRAQIAKLIVNAKNTVVGTVESGLKVSLDPNQSPAVTVPLGSTATLIRLDLTAMGSDVHVSAITLTRKGVGNASDWSGVYLYESPANATSAFSINPDSNQVTIPVDLNIMAGITTTVTAYADSKTAASPSDQHYFYLASSADITSDAKQVVGIFPESGNAITIGNEFANSLSIAPGSALSEPIRDQVSEIATFKLTAGNSGRVSLNVITLTQGGTLNSDKIKTCSLLHDADVIAKADQFAMDRLTFSLETPYAIPSGQNRYFSVDCHIDGGRSTDTVQLYLDEAHELQTTDMNYGFSAALLNGFTQTLAPGINLRPVSIIIQ